MSWIHSLFRLFPFAALITGSFWLQGENIQIPYWVPYALALFGGVFSWYFKRANITIAFLFSAASAFILFEFQNIPTIVTGITILFPLNIWLLSIWVERGLVSPAGISKMVLLFIQLIVLFLLTFAEMGRYAPILSALLTYHPAELVLPFKSPLVFLSLSLFGLSGLWFAIKALRQTYPLNLGWLSFCAISAYAFWMPDHFILFFTTGLACLSLSIILESYRMAFLDELTGLPGRRALLSDMKKLGSRYVVAMADIDHFKKFNDTYGHDVGDQVLRMVASNLDKVSGGGRAYRYGGEEFTILFPNKNVDGAMDHLERVRKRVEEASFTLRGQDRPKKKPRKNKGKSSGTTVRVTSSFGAAERTKDHTDPMAVMKAADQALYRAKKAGRNQVSS